MSRFDLCRGRDVKNCRRCGQKDVKAKNAEEDVRCKNDFPLDRRVALSFSLGLRRQLIEWGYAKLKVRIKEEDSALVIGGFPVLKAVVQDYKLNMDWTSAHWKLWADFVDSQEFTKLDKRAAETLTKAKDGKGKGDGKGKKDIVKMPQSALQKLV